MLNVELIERPQGSKRKHFRVGGVHIHQRIGLFLAVFRTTFGSDRLDGSVGRWLTGGARDRLEERHGNRLGGSARLLRGREEGGSSGLSSTDKCFKLQRWSGRRLIANDCMLC